MEIKRVFCFSRGGPQNFYFCGLYAKFSTRLFHKCVIFHLYKSILVLPDGCIFSANLWGCRVGQKTLSQSKGLVEVFLYLLYNE